MAKSFVDEILRSFHTECSSDSDTMYEPSDWDCDSVSSSDSNSSVVSENDFFSDIPPLNLSDIQNMPTSYNKDGLECFVCIENKNNFIDFQCCNQLVCKDCAIQVIT